MDTPSLFAADFVFAPVKDSLEAREGLLNKVYSLLASLKKNGQTYGSEIMAWTGGSLHVMCHVPRPDSLSPEHLSGWGKRDYNEILSLLGEPPAYRILDDGPFPQRYPKWQTAPTLCLFTNFLDITSPVRSGKDGAPLPLYTLPLSDIQKEAVVFWQDEYKAADRLWIGSGALEIPVYRQMADPDGGLSVRGRGLRRDIETTTQKPTYYYLTRYWGRKTGEADRLCPGCGMPWAAPSQDKGFFDFEFRCDACRLVSHQGVSLDDERHARIGEFRKSATRSQAPTRSR